jgi:hypothetical protein
VNVRLVVDEAAVEQLLRTPQAYLAEVTARVFGDALRYCPVDTGAMLASMRMQVRPGVGIVSVGTDHWMYTEYGARPHKIRPRGNYPLRFFWRRVGQNVEFWEVNHPGTPTVAYMRRALYQDRNAFDFPMVGTRAPIQEYPGEKFGAKD